ncbi:hypothetical protein KY342_00955 [Candidatus Woesearchaeota archaeon]|nr:hypothetical protein [Candidatus Woesearchaeota archaeon]
MKEVWFFDKDGAKRIPIGESYEDYDVGDLSKDDFDEMRKWEMLRRDNCYIAFRQCVKKGISGEGDPMELHIYFTAFLKNRNYEETEEDINCLYQELVEEMKSRIDEYVQKNPDVRIVSRTSMPPDYMIKELENMFLKTSN